MSAHPLPVPPANQGTKGQGDHANVKQNTRHPAARGDR